MGESLSRRNVMTLGAAGAAGAALPLVGAGPVAAAPAEDERPSGGLGRMFDVTRFGAKGDGVAIDTDAINRAIEVAAAAAPRGGGGPGGTVYFPAGTYASYSIHLKSNVALYLAANATILGATPTGGQGYDLAEPGAGNPYQDYGHSHWHNSLIWGEGLENIIIYGPGKIDGTGLVRSGSQESAPLQGNKAIALKLCRNVAIRDITILNGGHFAILPTGVDTLYDGTFKIPTSYGRTGRIKFGTESNGGFKNIAISNVIFEYCRGFALETVDGGLLEDVTISNITMRNVQMPFFFRLGARMRGPAGIPIGTLRRVSISNVIAYNADPRYPSTIAGIPGHSVEDIRISNVRHDLAGGLTPADAVANPPELENAYPEPSMFGTLPAFGFFIRHAKSVTLDNVEVKLEEQDTRPAIVLRDVAGADFHHTKADKVQDVPTFALDGVDDFLVTTSRPVADTHLDHVDHKEL